MEEEFFLIHELARKAKVSVRAIRFYIEKGLLPEAPVKGRYAAYSAEYLDRLELIAWLKLKHLPLDEIRSVTADLTPEQVREALNKRDEQLKKEQNAIQSTGQASLPGIQQEKVIFSGDDPLQSNKMFGKNVLQGGSVWERVMIVPGVELHFRRPVNSRRRQELQDILNFARTTLRKDDIDEDKGETHGSDKDHSTHS